MNPFENPIPKKPTEAGANYFEDKKQDALKRHEEQLAKEAQAKEDAFVPFDSPLNPESKEDEMSIEKKLRLLSGILSNIEKLEEELLKYPEEIRTRTGEAHQIEKLEVLEEQLRSQISPSELENYMKSQKEHNN